MRGLADYSRVKDRYLLYYGGPNKDYLLELALIRPHLENIYPGLQIFIGCKDINFHAIESYTNVLNQSKIKETQFAFGHIRTIESSGITHPIENLLKESGLSTPHISVDLSVRTTKCVIVTRGNFPVGPLTQRQTETLIRIAKSEGYDPEVGMDVENAGLVLGVESYPLILAASQGIETRLVPTGVGTQLYRSLFRNGKVLDI